MIGLSRMGGDRQTPGCNKVREFVINRVRLRFGRRHPRLGYVNEILLSVRVSMAFE